MQLYRVNATFDLLSNEKLEESKEESKLERGSGNRFTGSRIMSAVSPVGCISNTSSVICYLSFRFVMVGDFQRTIVSNPISSASSVSGLAVLIYIYGSLYYRGHLRALKSHARVSL